MQASFEQHLRRQIGVVERPARSETVFPHESQLVYATPSRHVIEKAAVKRQHIRLRTRNALGNRFLPEPVHNRGDIDVVGTSNGAGETAGAHPDRVRSQGPVLLADRQQVHEPMGKGLHFFSNGTTGRTLATLVAERRIFFPRPLRIHHTLTAPSSKSIRPVLSAGTRPRAAYSALRTVPQNARYPTYRSSILLPQRGSNVLCDATSPGRQRGVPTSDPGRVGEPVWLEERA